MRYAIALWLLLSAGLAVAQDGLPSGVPFDLPVVVSGKTVIGKALIQATEAADKPLVVFYVGADNTLKTLTYSIRRGEVQPGPNPGPDPQPNPNPKPLPTPTELTGVVIEESSQRTPAQAVVLASKDVRAELKTFRLLDKDQTVTADLQPYLDRAKPEKLPVLYLVDAKGAVYYEGSLPATAAELAALIRQKKGVAK